MTSFTYILSIFFTKPSTAQFCIIFVILILGVVLSSIGNFLRVARYLTHDDPPSIAMTELYMSTFRYLFAIFPPFALGEALNNMTLLTVYSLYELGSDKLYDVSDWNITGLALNFMAWETVVYFGLVVAYEYFSEMPLFQCLSKRELTDSYTLKDDGKLAYQNQMRYFYLQTFEVTLLI